MQILKGWYNNPREYGAGLFKHHTGSRASCYNGLYSLCFLLSGEGIEINYKPFGLSGRYGPGYKR